MLSVCKIIVQKKPTESLSVKDLAKEFNAKLNLKSHARSYGPPSSRIDMSMVVVHTVAI
jgi:hypothetical protein